METKKKFYYIYKITCLLGSFTGKYYIGQHQTNNLEDGYAGSGRKISNYYKKYGCIEGVSYNKEILCYCDSWEEMQLMEESYIGSLYNTDNNCLNLKGGGGQPKYSEELINHFIEVFSSLTYRNNVSKGVRNHILNYPDFKIKCSENAKRMWERDGYKEWFSDMMKDVWASPEYRSALGASIKKYYEDNPDARLKVSKNSKRMWKKDGYREWFSDMMKDVWASPGYKDAVRASIKKYDEEHPERIQKIREFQQSYWTPEKCEEHSILMTRIYNEHPEYRDHISDGGKRSYIEHPERHQIQSDNSKNMWAREGFRDFMSENMIQYDIEHPERAQKISVTMTGKNIGKTYVNNGNDVLFVTQEEAKYLISIGWKPGGFNSSVQKGSWFMTKEGERIYQVIPRRIQEYLDNNYYRCMGRKNREPWHEKDNSKTRHEKWLESMEKNKEGRIKVVRNHGSKWILPEELDEHILNGWHQKVA